MNQKIKDLAVKAYDAYTAAVGGVNYQGEPLPTGAEFFADPSKEKQQAGWLAAVNATYEGGTFSAALHAMKIGKGATRPGLGGVLHKRLRVNPENIGTAYFGITREDGLTSTWAPTCEDLLAEDWEIVD